MFLNKIILAGHLLKGHISFSFLVMHPYRWINWYYFNCIVLVLEIRLELFGLICHKETFSWHCLVFSIFWYLCLPLLLSVFLSKSNAVIKLLSYRMSENEKKNSHIYGFIGCSFGFGFSHYILDSGAKFLQLFYWYPKFRLFYYISWWYLNIC